MYKLANDHTKKDAVQAGFLTYRKYKRGKKILAAFS